LHPDDEDRRPRPREIRGTILGLTTDSELTAISELGRAHSTWFTFRSALKKPCVEEALLTELSL
jgi:hypothetical protein